MSGFLYLRTHSHCRLGVPLGGHLYFSFGLHEVWYMYISYLCETQNQWLTLRYVCLL